MTPESVLVVGAGCFGLSTAYHLLRRGFKDVTVIDRSPTIPAPDAASYDLNKIVRTSYNDEFYAKLAHESIQLWKSEEEWGDCYHEPGVLVVGDTDSQSHYVEEAYENDKNLGVRLEPLPNAESIRKILPPGININVGSNPNVAGYLNHDGGWANASKGIRIMASKVIALGGKIHLRKAVTKLVRRGNGLGNACTSTCPVAGVRCADDTEYHADVVVLATGSWTASTFPELGLQRQCLATGQSIAMIQLTEEEAAPYRQCPVFLDLGGSGFYIFPPNDDNIVKMAIHSIGVTHSHPPSSGGSYSPISTPRTVVSHAQDGLRIPKASARALRHHLQQLYPDLARKPFCGTRLCWYTDSPDGDWVIGFHPSSDRTLMLATSGSGHAYKFLPVIGRLVCDSLLGTIDPRIQQKFAVDRKYESSDSSRPRNEPPELDLEQLCTPNDLLP